MAGGFSFPPPPPPPPKPAAQGQPSEASYPAQGGRGGRGRGGFESRGRGGAGRGRGGHGNSNFEPLGQQQRPNFNQESTQPRERYEASYNGSAGIPMSLQPPPGSHFNPHFAGQRQGTTSSASSQPSARPQDRNFHRSGEQSSTDTRSNNTPNRRLSNDGPGRNHAGHKRKLDALRGPQQPREKKPGPQTAPSVPSFGAPILPPAPPTTASRPSVQAQRNNASGRPQAASKGLGLTPKEGVEPEYPSESEDDDEVDEEAQYAELGTKLTFEHNGEVMTLNNEADLAAWKEERRKQFPTSNRVSEKESEALRIGEERKRLLAAVARLHQAPRNRNTEMKTRSLREPPKPSEDTTSPMLLDEGVDDPREPEAQQPATVGPAIVEMEDAPTTATAETNTTDSSVVPQEIATQSAFDDNTSPRESTLSKPELAGRVALPGINMDDTDDESIAEAATVEEVAHAAASVEIAAESSDSDSDDDGPPEQASSKPRLPAASDAQRPLCRYFSASGRCRDGDSCRYRHELSSNAPSARPLIPQPDKPAFDRFAPKLDPKTNDRKSIFQRLVEQEEQGDNRLALQVIKALGQAGFFNEPGTEVNT